MPARTLPLVTGEIYHVVNRGNASVPIFKTKHDYQKFTQAFLYYQNDHPPLRFSKFSELSRKDKDELLSKVKKERNLLVEIIASVLMPNHFHFLLKQTKDSGIANFIRLSTNSYSRYFNLKYKRKGHLFEGRFLAVRVETEPQLLHLSRYLHLNPYSSYVVKDLKGLLNYPHSSLLEYLGNPEENIYQKEIILTQFSSSAKYKDFLLDRADYQRVLETIKHQLLEG